MSTPFIRHPGHKQLKADSLSSFLCHGLYICPITAFTVVLSLIHFTRMVVVMKKLPVSCNKDCGGGCPLIAHVENGRLLKITNNPLRNRYMTGCVRGYQMPKAAYENPDGTPLKIDTDYFGKKRSQTNPSAGPFENPGEGKLTLKVW